MNIELKADGYARRRLVRAVARMIEGRAAAGNLLVSCFNPLIVELHALLAPSIPTAWLVDSPLLCRLPLLPRVGRAAFHPKHSLLNAAAVAGWKARGLRVHTWTVNDDQRARELAAFGVDCLISDRPGGIRRALAQPNAVPTSGELRAS